MAPHWRVERNAVDVAQWVCAADKLGLPRIVSIRNPYGLLNRSYEFGLSEYANRGNVALLAYSPLGFGWQSCE